MTGKPNKIIRFWKELRRRRVVHVITVYASAAFVIIELINNLSGPLNLPGSLSTIVIIVLAIGLPLAIILSWLYDLSPEGVERTRPIEETKEGDERNVPNAWKIATYISFVVILGLLAFNLTGRIKNDPSASIKSLVVLPFDNNTGDDQQEYFLSGMHSSVIGELGKISGLRVVSQTSANAFKESRSSVPEIASELTVDAVVETNVLCLGDSVCVQFKLFSAFPHEQLLWSGTYDSELGNILSLYSWVIRDIAHEIKLPLSPEQETRLAEKRPVDPEAYKLYLNGKFHMGYLTRESQQTAMDYFNQAIEIDPEYAAPYAGIAGVWGFLKQMDYVSPDVASPQSQKYIAKAIQLDSESPEVHYYNGLIKVWTDFNWEEGERALRKCLEINPSFSEARAYLSHLMMLLKRPDEMREQMKLALENDPKNPLIQVLAIVEMYVESEYELCIEKMLAMQKIQPNNPLAMLTLFECYTETARYDLAIAELRKMFAQLADESVLETLDKAYADGDFKKALNAAADVWVEQADFASAQHAIMLYSYGGNADKAMYWLEKSYIREDPTNAYMGVLPYLRFYHDDPRYIEIMQRMNLPLDPPE